MSEVRKRRVTYYRVVDNLKYITIMHISSGFPINSEVTVDMLRT